MISATVNALHSPSDLVSRFNARLASLPNERYFRGKSFNLAQATWPSKNLKPETRSNIFDCFYLESNFMSRSIYMPDTSIQGDVFPAHVMWDRTDKLKIRIKLPPSIAIEQAYNTISSPLPTMENGWTQFEH